MKLTVVIVNYNVRYFLEQCLLSVQRAIENIDAEVYVVDNRSGDGSCDMVRQKFPWVKLIENKDNVGFSKANNQAMRVAKGEYILLLNPDTVVVEDTFEKCLQFMDQHPDAGGLGVRMIDGKGNFLPESKRGLPTPEVAFYKIFGLSSFFPKSKRFGQYHLSYLSEHENHSIDILAGAYMLMRKTALDKVGLLDEDFFMYGEDIDLSWRIKLGGYNNYYFSDTSIIHYKGESTKKSSINYVFVFYNAMIIFAQKHFSKSKAGLFEILIRLAIYFRASLAILKRFAERIWVPTIDFASIIGSFWALQQFYSWRTGIQHPENLVWPSFISIGVIYLITILYAGGYDTPFKWKKLWKGIAFSSLFVLVSYALLPENMRFSRAIITVGSVLPILSLSIVRFLLTLVGLKEFHWKTGSAKRMAVVGEFSELARVKHLITSTLQQPEVMIEVAPTNQFQNKTNHFIATIGQLKEVVQTFKLNEVIFCGESTSSFQIINEMSYLEDPNLEYKIAPRDTEFIIGSSSIHTPGSLYSIDNLNAIVSPHNKRAKRTVDLLSTLFFFIFSPILILFQREKIQFLSNLFQVAVGRKTWVGFLPLESQKHILPKIKPAILKVGNSANSQNKDSNNTEIANINYARTYQWWRDIGFILKNIQALGTKK